MSAQACTPTVCERRTHTHKHTHTHSCAHAQTYEQTYEQAHTHMPHLALGTLLPRTSSCGSGGKNGSCHFLCSSCPALIELLGCASWPVLLAPAVALLPTDECACPGSSCPWFDIKVGILLVALSGVGPPSTWSRTYVKKQGNRAQVRRVTQP